MTNEKILITFLKSHRKYSSFKRNRSYQQLNNNTPYVHNAIFSAFSWRDSEEGSDCWVDLNTKWKNLCVHFQLKSNIDYNKLK